MTEATEVTADIRDVTDSEIAFYREHGWVKVESLISADRVSKLLTRAKEIMGEHGDAHELRPGRDKTGPDAGWHDYHGIAQEDETFGSLALDKKMGLNAQRFFGRDVPARLFQSSLAVKLGKSQETASSGKGKTRYHQDFTAFPMDRSGALSVWIALDEVTPEMGAMRFYSGSQRLGNLGNVRPAELWDVYPDLELECPLSPPIHYRPGDATVHNAMTVHGAPENSTDRPRWPLILIYFPGDTTYTGATPSEHNKHQMQGIEVGDVFDKPYFPQIFP